MNRTDYVARGRQEFFHGPRLPMASNLHDLGVVERPSSRGMLPALSLCLGRGKTHCIPERIGNFSPNATFVVDRSPQASVRIHSIDQEFSRIFLGKKEKVEKSLGTREILSLRTERGIFQNQLIRLLGGSTKVEMNLSEVFFLMSQQPYGEDHGDLLTNRYVNIFFVRDSRRVLRTIGVRWCKEGWALFVPLDSSQYVWKKGHRTFTPFAPRLYLLCA